MDFDSLASLVLAKSTSGSLVAKVRAAQTTTAVPFDAATIMMAAADEVLLLESGVAEGYSSKETTSPAGKEKYAKSWQISAQRAYKDGNPAAAVAFLTAALLSINCAEIRDEPELSREVFVSLLCNRSSALLRLGESLLATNDAVLAILLNLHGPKAWFRLHEVRSGKGTDGIDGLGESALELALSLSSAEPPSSEVATATEEAAIALVISVLKLKPACDDKKLPSYTDGDMRVCNDAAAIDNGAVSRGNHWADSPVSRGDRKGAFLPPEARILLREHPSAMIPTIEPIASTDFIRFFFEKSPHVQSDSLCNERVACSRRWRCCHCLQELLLLKGSDNPSSHAKLLQPYAIPCLCSALASGSTKVKCTAVFCSARCAALNLGTILPTIAAGESKIISEWPECPSLFEAALHHLTCRRLPVESRLAVYLAMKSERDRSGGGVATSASCGSAGAIMRFPAMCTNIFSMSAERLSRLALHAALANAELWGTFESIPPPASPCRLPSSGSILIALCQVACNAFAVKHVLPSSPTASKVASAVQELREVRLGLAVYERASLFNHSCAPNCLVRFDADGSIVVSSVSAAIEHKASADSHRCSELTVSYGYGDAGSDLCVPPLIQRRSHLQQAYGFQCACSLCAAESRASTVATTAPLMESSISASSSSLRKRIDRCLRIPGEMFHALRGGAADSGASVAILQEEALHLFRSLSTAVATGASAAVDSEGDDSAAVRASCAHAAARLCGESARSFAERRSWDAAAAWVRLGLEAQGVLRRQRREEWPPAALPLMAPLDVRDLVMPCLAQQPGLALEAFKLAQLAWNAATEAPISGSVPQDAETTRALLQGAAAYCRRLEPVLRALLPAGDDTLIDLEGMLALDFTPR